MKIYFDKHKWDNATLKDLIDAMAMVNTDKTFNVQDWCKSWVQQAGLNTIFVKKKYNTIEIIQGSVLSEHMSLRKHKMQVALF